MDPAIPNRDDQHGGVQAVGETAQRIKGTMRSTTNWTLLSYGGREALDMIAHKIARILAGDNADGRHDPAHPMHALYTGLAQAAQQQQEVQQ